MVFQRIAEISVKSMLTPPEVVVVTAPACVTGVAVATTFTSIAANVRIAAAGELSIGGDSGGISDLGPNAWSMFKYILPFSKSIMGLASRNHGFPKITSTPGSSFVNIRNVAVDLVSPITKFISA